MATETLGRDMGAHRMPREDIGMRTQGQAKGIALAEGVAEDMERVEDEGMEGDLADREAEPPTHIIIGEVEEITRARKIEGGIGSKVRAPPPGQAQQQGEGLLTITDGVPRRHMECMESPTIPRISRVSATTKGKRTPRINSEHKMKQQYA